MKNIRLKHLLILVLLSGIFFILGNSILPITSPDEVFYVQTAKEMVKHNSWLTPYLFDQPQFEKPIFIYWIMRLEFVLFGPSNFSVRFVFSLFGIIGVVAVYFLSLIGFKDENKAFISSLVLASSALYIGLSRIVMTDMVFFVFITLAILFFLRDYLKKKKLGIVLFFIFSALAVLTKGPLGLILPFLTVLLFLLIRRDLKYLYCSYFLWGIICFVVLALPWYALVIYKHGWVFIREFFYNDHIRRIFEAEHNNDTWYYYPVLLFAGMFPWGILMLLGLKRLILKIRDSEEVYLFLACWIGVVFCVFQIAHSKLMHYIFPAFPAVALVVGDYIQDSLNKKARVFTVVLVGTVLIASGLPLAVSLLFLSSPAKIIPSINIYSLAVASMLFATICAILVLRSKLKKLLYMFVLVCPFIIFWIFSCTRSLSPYISTAQACDILLNKRAIGNTIITSKYFARDVRYNTSKNIAVFYLNGKNFFSPHPIPFIDSYSKLEDFIVSQGQIYCILDKNSARKFKRIADEGFQVELIDIVADKYILAARKTINPQ